MKFYQAKTPIEYQEIFYKHIGLQNVKQTEQEVIWENPKIGFIHSYGTLETIQSGIGNYTVPSDFFVEYQYSAVYLHFGIIHEGITYSVIDNKLTTMALPSAFLAVEEMSRGINSWKKGQHFKGVEISIEMNYLKSVLFPFLGLPEDTLSFLEENVRYIQLPEEMIQLILRIEQLLSTDKMTMALQTSICLEFIAILIHEDNWDIFHYREKIFFKYVQVGNRKIKFTKEDFEKIVMVHDRIKKEAVSFFTIYELSQEVHISEQKLKAGFQELYQQTIWDYANSIRMNKAVNLLQNTELCISDIAKAIGYQSQAAFINMFKKLFTMTPRQFRFQVQSLEKIK